MDERSVSNNIFEKTILVVAIALMLGIVAYYVGANCIVRNLDFASDMCGNDIVDEVDSPDGEYKVVVFERNCGATTGFSTHISILYNSEELSNSPGNIFSMDGHPASSQVVTMWVDDQTVNVSYKEGYDVYSREGTYMGINREIFIEYPFDM